MKKKFLLFRNLFFLIVFMASTYMNAQDYQKQVFRFKFDKSVESRLGSMKIQKSTDGVVRTGFVQIDQLSQKYKASKMRRVFPYAGKFEAKHRKYGLHLWYEVEVDVNSDVLKAKEEYSKLSEVSKSELILKKNNREQRVLANQNKSLGSLPGGTNDPLYPQQWHYNNTGQSGGTVDADIDLPEAWAIQTGSSDVIVSVHDGGIDFDHVDLAGNMWVNPNEIPGNGIDDDANGYVDDIYGYNFADDTGALFADDHGTHVAGTIAAETNNGVGMSGIVGGTGNNDGVRLMSCEVFGEFSSDGFPESYIYAADNGAVISQNSWGYTNPNSYEQAVLDAIDYFIAEAGRDEMGNQVGPMAGGLVIFAAGNDGSDNLWYPGYYEPIIAVAGTDHNDNKYTSSNFGAWVDIAAPAVNIYSTIPNNNYTGGYNGTSMACPHVSGVAALILSQFKDDGITPQQIWDRLVNTTDPLTFAGAENWGTGRVNAFKALAEDDGIPPLAITDMSVSNVSAVTVDLIWTAPADQPDNYPATYYDFRYSTSPITAANFNSATSFGIPAPSVPGTEEAVVISGLTPGTTYYFAVKSSDYFGNTSSISNTVTATTDQAPEIVISGNPGVNIDVSVDPVETGQFTIQNQGLAALSYQIFPVYSGRTSSAVATTLIFPGTEVSINPETSYPVTAKLNSQTSGSPGNGVKLNFDNEVANIITYEDGDETADGSIAVTASGTPVVWAGATAFIVPDLGGEKFILSKISAYIDASGGAASTPTSLSIVAGGDLPSQGELLLSQDFTNVIGEQYVTIPLEMPIAFDSGDKFWVIFTFPSEPLRLGYDEVPGANRPGSYLVYLNGGWMDIQEQSGWDEYVWTVRAIQTNLQGVTLDVNQGNLSAGASQNINVTYDASDVTRNGDYNFNIFVLSNDPVTPVSKIMSKAVVTGIPVPVIDVEPDSIISAIDVSINPIKTETLTIYNNGEGELLFDFEKPVIEQEIHVAAFTGEYPKGGAAASKERAPYVNPVMSSSIPVEQLAGTIAYAQEVYPNSFFVSFSSDNPGTYLTSQTVSYTAYAGDFAKGDNENMYIVDDDALLLVKLNISTGGLTTIGSTLDFTDLACDKSSGIMYGTYYNGTSSVLYTIDLSSGATTQIGTIGAGIMISMACDGNGNLWGLNLDDNIYSIDKSDGHMTLVGAAGFDANYAQSMAWDPISGIIYLAAYNYGTDNGELRVLDTETGATQLIGAFPGNAEITAFGFPGGGTPDFVSVSPLSGTVAANSSTTVEVQIDASLLPNGSYNSSLTVYSNDYDNLSTVVPVNLDVTGQIGEISISNVFIEFGAVFLNGEKELPIVIANTGIGDLEISEVSSNLPIFSTDFPDTTILALGDSLIVMAKFKPTALGQFNAIITVKSNDPANHAIQVTVTGVAISPPVIGLVPEEVNLTLDAGQKTTTTFTIQNTGLYPLQYSMPTVAATMLLNNPEVQKNDISMVEVQSAEEVKGQNSGNNGHPVLLGAGGPDDLGYRWIDSHENGGPIYVWEDIAATGTEILPASDDDYEEIDLPFSFKFCGNYKSSIKIGANGYLTFGVDGTDYTNDQIPSTTDPNDYIAPFWDDLRPSGNSGQVFYLATADKLIVQYQEVGNYAGSGTITFQVVIYPNGNINFYYKEVGLSNATSATIGIENEDGTIGTQVAYNTAYVSDSLAVLIFPGRTPFDVTASKVAGIVQPGSEQIIELTVDATDLVDDSYINELLISSNDPVHPQVTFTTRLDVTGHPEITVNPDSLDYGSIFQTLSVVRKITIGNTGSKNLTISSISSDNASFTLDYTAPLIIAPSQSSTVDVTYTAINLGVANGTITISSDDEFGNEMYVVSATGTGLVPPVISVVTDPDPVEITMNSGDKDSILVSVGNTGGSPLNYVMIKPYYTSLGAISVNQNAAPDLTTKEQEDARVGLPVLQGSGGPDNFGYTWIDSDESSEVLYDWIEITGIGTKLDLGADDGVYVNLPFDFPFYNGTYNQVQVASNGFLTFADDLGSIGGFSNQDIPNSSAPNNLIAPMWDDIEPQDGDGVYLYSTPEYIVIQYNDVPKFLSTTTCTFQAILYSNGSIKFQYKDVNSYAGLNSTTVGVENEDGSGALKVVFNNTYLKDGLAVLIKSPFVIGTVEPGNVADVELLIDAANIYDGVYNAPLKVLSNDPVNSSIEIPTTLTVTGTPIVNISTSELIIDSVYYATGMDFYKTKELIVKNVGTKKLLIDSLWFSNELVVFSADKSGAFELEPTEEMSVHITFTPNAVGLFENTFNVTSNDQTQPVITCQVIGKAIEPPVLTVNPRDTLMLDLKSTESVVNTSVVSNTGGSVLNYSAQIVYLPAGFGETTASAFVRPIVSSSVYRALSPKNEVEQTAAYQAFDVEFQDSIIYDPEGAPDDYYGYGGSAGYSSANRFIVTSASFNLTHIANYYQNDGSAESVILEIYKGGSLPANGDLLVSQTFTHAEATNGANCLIELAQPQSFVLGDVFFVVMHYPSSISYPAAFNNGVSGVDGVSYWYDVNTAVWLNEDPGYVYKMRAYQATGGSVTEWLSINPTEGTIDAGGSINHSLAVNASATTGGYHYAKVVYSSSDPITPSVEWPVQLYVNKLPEIISASDTVFVNEGQVVETEIVANDPEGGALNFAFAGSYPFMVLNVNGNAATITYSPDYNEAGIHDVIVNVTDNKGESTAVSCAMVVKNVNRSPVLLTDIDNQLYFISDPVKIIKLSDYFSDPDGETLTYAAFAGSNSYFTTTIDGNLLKIDPTALGIEVITVTATDAEGAYTAASFNVRIRHSENHAPNLKKLIPALISVSNKPVVFDLDDYFTDIDWDEIVYSFQLYGNQSALITLTGSELKISKISNGMSVLTIFADDQRGGKTGVTTVVFVYGRKNSMPHKSADIGNKLYSVSGKTDKIKLTDFFSDPDNDNLSFVCVVENGTSVATSLKDNVLEITPAELGESKITIFASDENTGFVSTSFTATVNSSTSIVETDVKEMGLNNYPNPFTRLTTIEYQLEKAGDVRLEVLNIHGKTIEILVDDQREAGKYTIDYNAKDLSSGIYLYRLTIDNQETITKRMIVK